MFVEAADLSCGLLSEVALSARVVLMCTRAVVSNVLFLAIGRGLLTTALIAKTEAVVLNDCRKS